MARLDWLRLLSVERLPDDVPSSDEAPPDWVVASRTQAERDYDRVLFSTPTRRLGDKTQVFPLEKNESVRNRLTHSHEVADLARSIGTHLIHSSIGQRIVDEVGALHGNRIELIRRGIPATLGAAGLAHDMGNPPFGHEGENAIRSWIRRNENRVFGVSPEERQLKGDEGCKAIESDLEKLNTAHREDFRRFEGNAQTLRTLTRLQVVKDNRGLNLTFGTLAATMKYTVGSDRVQKGGPSHAKKVGHFVSEIDLVRSVRDATGLSAGDMRHPLTFLMEACDNSAYVVVDAEDAVKKHIVSFADLWFWLEHQKSLKNDQLSLWVLGRTKAAVDALRESALSPAEFNDVAMQIFRATAITALVSATIRGFEERYDDVMEGKFDGALLDSDLAKPFVDAMKDFDRQNAYKHRRVLEIELSGYNTLQGLMDMLWRGITERESFVDVKSDRLTPFAKYAYGRISENYRRVFEGKDGAARISDKQLPIRYRELQLLTDMVAGMTDQFAIDLHDELKAFHIGASLS